jgi:NACHT domain
MSADRRHRAAGPLRLRIRALWNRLYHPVVRWRNARRASRGRRSVERTQSWRHSSPLIMAVRIATAVIAVIFFAWIARAILVVIRNDPGRVPLNLEDACANTDLSCDAISNSLTPILTIVLASAVFLFYRLSRVHRPYLKRAKVRPKEIVETAGQIIGEVVGRDELCQVVIRDLRDRDTRRPHVVVGGVGTGKTALLVRLTELLAKRGAVPVPVRLRDAQDQLDFRELARRRFLADADVSLLSDAEGEKVWRQLCRDDRVVVLADGLEEALIEGDAEKERDNRIRLALRRAHQDGLPLVVASRPHDPLRGMEASIVELEPLSEEAALDYIQPVSSPEEEQRLDWIVETADVAETPLYLQVTRQLHRAGLLAYVSPTRDEEWFDIRSVDRAALRFGLLDTYARALVRGHFPSGVPLSPEERNATLEQLSALACIGLKKDRLYVAFDDVESRQSPLGTGVATVRARPAQVASWVRARLRLPPSRPDPAAPPYPAIAAEVEQRLEVLGRRSDFRLAATWGTQLGLVEAGGDGVRFPHSIMQAYLGSRLIDVAMTDDRYRSEALENPGRELLIALVLRSRAEAREEAASSEAGSRRMSRRPGGTRRRHRDQLRDAARQRTDVKALDLYAAAFEIDSTVDIPVHQQLAAELHDRWPVISARDPGTLEEAKLNLVHRFGDAARQIVQRRAELASPATPAYLELYRISCAEPSYPIRLAAAQEIGAGGDEALQALEGELGPPTGDVVASRAGQDEERNSNEVITRAWLAPLLVGSARTRPAREAARDRLEEWLELVGTGRRAREPSRLRLSFEVALAQGFKLAANRRRDHPQAHPEARAYLAQQAREMVRRTRFWFSRLTLLHALCLWTLPETAGGRLPGRGRDADPWALVDYWMDVPDGQQEHPFVVEARTLTVWALETRQQPERFIWIDESGVVARVGSRPARGDVRRKHNLWIPPSTGWTALHPRALRLVADVLVLLNLAERGGRPIERERRLRKINRSYLPPCLAGKRGPLDPTRTAGLAATSEPGSNCTAGCPFELCPYPPRSEGSYRVELSEALCRRQQALVREGWVRRRAAPWQETLPRDLKRFWKQMGQRTHTPELDLKPVGDQDNGHGRRWPLPWPRG